MSIGRSPFGLLVNHPGQDAQTAGEAEALPPGPPPAPPGPPPPPFPPSGPPPLPARAVRFRSQIVGHVDRDGVFVRRVQARHILQRPEAIALHIDVLATLASMGAVDVAFTLDDGTVLVGPLSLYTGPRAIDVDRGGYGPQRAVLVADFARLEIRRATADDVADFMAAVSR